MITKILVGTGNPSKLKHYQKYFQDSAIKLVSAKEMGILEEPEENGTTMEENAIMKAKHYCEKSGLPTIADDAGFEIPALGNFPGVNSRRFAGHDMTDDEIINGILDRMKGLKGEQRRASMKIVCALALSPGQVYTASGAIEGHVPEISYEKREEHFPYRSLLFVDKLNVWFGDVAGGLEDQIDHRKAAVEKLKKYLV